MSSKDPEPAASGPVQFVPGNCRDCGAAAGGGNRCPACRSPRLARHDEIGCLEIAHLDCDAFFASVEKRDRPELTDQPVIIGGGRRGVVSTACYIARIHGIHSAMPMFKALKACPEAVVIKPDMEKYVTESRRIRRLMQALTPLVEPVSIDEAFLDLSGTEALHGMTPAVSMINLARRIEVEIGITVSVGLSHNKFLAKLASDLDKPRGFSVIGREETLDFLSPRKVTDIWGVGAVTGRQLAAAGLKTMGDLQSADPKWLRARFGKLGARLASLACGRDNRRVTPKRPAKSISAETTFAHDITDPRALEVRLWRLCEQVASRAKAGGHHGATAVLKLKTTDFRTRTRNCRFAKPTQLADDLFDAVKPLLAREVDKGLTKGGDGTAFRLIGVGFTDLDHPAAQGCPPADFFATGAQRRAKVERTLDDLKKRFGDKVIGKGRAWE